MAAASRRITDRSVRVTGRGVRAELDNAGTTVPSDARIGTAMQRRPGSTPRRGRDAGPVPAAVTKTLGGAIAFTNADTRDLGAGR